MVCVSDLDKFLWSRATPQNDGRICFTRGNDGGVLVEVWPGRNKPQLVVEIRAEGEKRKLRFEKSALAKVWLDALVSSYGGVITTPWPQTPV